MDTFKEKTALDDLYRSGRRPWEVWNGRPAGRAPTHGNGRRNGRRPEPVALAAGDPGR